MASDQVRQRPAYLPDETAADLFRRTRSVPIPTRLSFIDDFLPEGGLMPGNCIELYGSSGSGKTEILYHIVCATILPPENGEFRFSGMGKSVLILDLDCRFNIIRLSSLLEGKIVSEIFHQNPEFDMGSFQQSDDFLKLIELCLARLLVVRCSSVSSGDELFSVLQHQLSDLVDEQRQLHQAAPLRLLVIDNIAAHYWIKKHEKDGMKFYDRLAAELRKAASAHQLSLISTKPAIFHRVRRFENSLSDDAYLGYALQNLFKFRIQVSQLDQTSCTDEQGKQHGVWQAKPMTLPKARPAESADQERRFTILNNGLIEIGT